MPERLALVAAAMPPGENLRRAYFGRRHGWLETPVILRSALAAGPRPGPLIVEEYDCTCLVPPRAEASLDDFGNIVIDLKGNPTA